MLLKNLVKKKLFFLKMIGKLRALHAKKHDSTIMLINYIHIHTFLHFSVYMYVCEYHTNWNKHEPSITFQYKPDSALTKKKQIKHRGNTKSVWPWNQNIHFWHYIIFFKYIALDCECHVVYVTFTWILKYLKYHKIKLQCRGLWQSKKNVAKNNFNIIILLL